MCFLLPLPAACRSFYYKNYEKFKKKKNKKGWKKKAEHLIVATTTKLHKSNFFCKVPSDHRKNLQLTSFLLLMEGSFGSTLTMRARGLPSLMDLIVKEPKSLSKNMNFLIIPSNFHPGFVLSCAQTICES